MVYAMDEGAMAVTLKVTGVLEQFGIPYVIVGSLASTVYGLARTTLDSDLLAAIQPHHIPALVQALQDEYYISADAMAEAIVYQSSFNLIHLATMFKVDIFIVKAGTFDQVQLAHGRLLRLSESPDQAAIVASPEDTILSKLVWYRTGGEVSERQLRDVQAILEVQRDGLDLAYLRHHARELGVADLLAALLPH